MLAKFGLLPNCTDAHFYPKIIAVFLSIQRTLYICNGIPKIVQGAGYINVNSPTLVVVFSMKKNYIQKQLGLQGLYSFLLHPTAS